MNEIPDNQQENQPESKRRAIRSFVIRGGRMTVGQEKAWEQGWSKYGLEHRQGGLDVQKIFGNDNPLVLEIGFGMGGSLSQMALNEPDLNFVGIEVHRPGVGALMMQIIENDIGNLRAYCHDAIDILNDCVADDSLARVQIYFPDPWHKKKHHKRRLIQDKFVQKLRKKLKVGGVLHIATDWEPYAEHIMEVMVPAEGYKNLSPTGGYCERPEYRPITKFEKRGQRLGHGVWDILFERCK